jgi:raffinose/stachyose/melibiose transport system substrate-binding protein
MQRRTQRHRFLFEFPLYLIALMSLLLSACGNSGAANGHVALNYISWQGGAAGDAYKAVIKAFEKAHPNITISYEVVNAGDLGTILKTRFGAGNAPDLVSLTPGSFKDPFISAGDLVDLSDQPWVSSLQASVKGAAASSTDPSKIYLLTTVQDVGGIIYNKDIFAKLNLQIPTTWAAFLQVCATIKASGIAPLALGAKDGWPLEKIINYTVINSVYRDDPSFHQEQASGHATYAGSAGWKQDITDILALKNAGYFNDGFASTDFAATTNLLATGKAAMTINGDFTLSPTEQSNPNIHLGMFPVPYVQSGQTPQATTFVDVTVGIARQSKHQDAAKQFLQFFAQSDTMASFLNQRQGLATLTNAGQYTVDPALQQILPTLNTNATNELALGTASDVSSVIWKEMQGVLTDTITVEQFLKDMDTANKSS